MLEKITSLYLMAGIQCNGKTKWIFKINLNNLCVCVFRLVVTLKTRNAILVSNHRENGSFCVCIGSGSGCFADVLQIKHGMEIVAYVVVVAMGLLV